MEESREVHEEDKVHENSKKRTLKTPAQVDALEKLYTEHKYPTESLKAQLADEIGLSEKQVSGWFCHRRLKDKNMLKDEAYGMGRQDLSSGIVQDRGSALKQDSCGSTKPGEYKYFDPKEVESRRFSALGSPVEDVMRRSRDPYVHAGSNIIMDNASSASTSASEGSMSPQKNPYGMESLRYSQTNNYTLANTTYMKPKGDMMGSKYLNSQNEIERAAILAVKRQLGRQYREDGPQLGVKFDSLPPSGFDALVDIPINGPDFVGDSIVPKSVGVLKVHKEPTLDVRYSQSKHEMRPRNSYPEGNLKQIRLERDLRNDGSSYHSLGKSSLTNGRSYDPLQYSLRENISDDRIGVSSIPNKTKKHVARPVHMVEGKKSNSVDNHYKHPYDKIAIASGSSYPRLHIQDVSSSRMLQNGDYVKGRPALRTHYGDCLDPEQTEQSRMTELDEENLYRERRKSKENVNSGRVKMQLSKKVKRKMTKQGDHYLPLDHHAPKTLEYLPFDRVSNTLSPRVFLPSKNHIQGYSGDVPTSFSDEETAAACSSVD